MTLLSLSNLTSQSFRKVVALFRSLLHTFALYFFKLDVLSPLIQDFYSLQGEGMKKEEKQYLKLLSLGAGRI